MKPLFVSGTNTEVGKTWISTRILSTLRRAGHRVGAWKPVCSGSVERDGRRVWEDVDLLTAAVTGDAEGRQAEAVSDRVCCQRFHAALAPNVAARREGRRVSDEQLRSGLDVWRGCADFVVVEGAGGLFSPLSDTLLGADLAALLQLPVLIVAGSQLGVIHQTLATIEAAAARGLTVSAVILNAANPDVSDAVLESSAAELKRLLTGIPLYCTFHDGPWLLTDGEVQSWFEAGRAATAVPGGQES